MEESEYEKPVSQEFQDKPRYSLSIELPGLREELKLEVSKKMNTDKLIGWISNFLAVSKDRIELLHQGKNVNKETLSFFESIFNCKEIAHPYIKVNVREKLLKEEQTPRYILINDNIHLGNLLRCLLDKPIEIVNLVWDFLVETPKNKILKGKFKPLNEKVDKEGWAKYLRVKDINDVHYFTYCFHTLLDLLHSLNNEEQASVCQELVKKHFLRFLYEVFTNNTQKEYTLISIKCLGYCLKLMKTIWDDVIVDKYTKDMWKSLLSIIEWLLNSTPDKMNIKEIPEILRSCIEIIIERQDAFIDHLVSKDFFELMEQGRNLIKYRVVFTVWKYKRRDW